MCTRKAQQVTLEKKTKVFLFSLKLNDKFDFQGPVMYFVKSGLLYR